MDVHAVALPRAIPTERRARTASPWVVAAVVAVAYALVAAPGLAHDPYQFINLSHKFLKRGTSSSLINQHAAGHDKEVGYDGQFYYFLAVDPTHAKDYMESPGIVYSRIGYPMTVRALSGGNASLIPYLMVLVNILAVVGGSLAVAFLLRRGGLSPWLALVYGFFPGLIVAAFRDLTEPMAFGLAAAGLAVFDPRSKRRLLGSAVLFGAAMLTRETIALFPAILAVALLVGAGTASSWRDRFRLGNLVRALTFVELVFAPFFAWRHIVGIWLNHPTLQEGPGTTGPAGGALYALVPFHGQAGQWPWSGENVSDLFVVVLPAVVWGAIAIALLRRRWSVEPWFVVANVLVFVVLLPTDVAVDYGGMGRSAIGVVLAALIALPQVTLYFADKSRGIRAAVALWTLPYYLLFAVPLVFIGPKYIW